MPTKFECPYCGEMLSTAEDLEFLRTNRTCPECEAGLDDEDLDVLLSEEDDDYLEEDEEAEYEEDEAVEAVDDDLESGFDDDMEEEEEEP